MGVAVRPAVLVLGRSGMLGSTVFHRLRALQPEWRIDGTEREPAGSFTLEADAGREGVARLFRINRYDYIVNCIGVLASAVDLRNDATVARAIRVNALFPHEIAEVASDHGARVFHVSTDAVFSGRQGHAYDEDSPPDPVDAYGMTKLLGECAGANVLNVRCSIVGRDRRQRGLLEWYLASRAESVVGFDDYVWTPVTTVQFADWCAATIAVGFEAVRRPGSVLHLVLNPPLSKGDFLRALRDAMGPGTRPAIEGRPNPGGPCSRILVSRRAARGDVAAASWSTVLSELSTEFLSRKGQ
jgi:dTDP-4-dehydrorhamnose reductase